MVHINIISSWLRSYLFYRLPGVTYQITERGAFVRRRVTAAEVLARISKEAVKFVDLQFADVPGRLRHVTLPSEMVHEGIFRDGVAKLDGSSVKGFVEIHESDSSNSPTILRLWKHSRTYLRESRRPLSEIELASDYGATSIPTQSAPALSTSLPSGYAFEPFPDPIHE